jgi:hypothetical protein
MTSGPAGGRRLSAGDSIQAVFALLADDGADNKNADPEHRDGVNRRTEFR